MRQGAARTDTIYTMLVLSTPVPAHAGHLVAFIDGAVDDRSVVDGHACPLCQRGLEHPSVSDRDPDETIALWSPSQGDRGGPAYQGVVLCRAIDGEAGYEALRRLGRYAAQAAPVLVVPEQGCGPDYGVPQTRFVGPSTPAIESAIRRYYEQQMLGALEAYGDCVSFPNDTLRAIQHLGESDARSAISGELAPCSGTDAPESLRYIREQLPRYLRGFVV